MIDTLGNMLEDVVHGADVQYRGRVPDLIERSCDAYPAGTRLFADGSYAGQKHEAAVAHTDRLRIKITLRSDLVGFVVILPRRWTVERTLGWLTDAETSPKIGKSPSHRPKPGSSPPSSGG